ncbi:DUF6632 domain-containing protein [Nocardia sp. CA-128927]|uniref:DUF6632 domain-containing protein n=1 Tax=Nocardia sp. CA-128927 TaxID=3239975 RepID=UPI003D977247
MAAGSAGKISSDFAIRVFPTVIRVIAIIFIAFFCSAWALRTAGVVQPGSLSYALLRWGHDQDATENMLCSIYIVWGIFLWFAADDPAKNWLFINFTIVANVAHCVTMVVMAIVMTGEHAHLLGDIPLILVCILPLMVLWLPVRRQITSAEGRTQQ